MDPLHTKIQAALVRLDPTMDDHWTSDGLPRVDVVANLTHADVKRSDITAASPKFTREHALELATNPDPTPEAEPEPQPQETAPEETQEQDQAPPAAEPEPEPAPVGSVLEMPVDVVMRSPDLLRAALNEMDEKAQALLAERKAIEDQLAELHGKIEFASRQLERMQGPVDSSASIREYLNRQAETRERRHQAAQKFISSGTTAKDVVDAMSGKSKLDQAMNQRRPGFGQQRPAPRAPIAT